MKCTSITLITMFCITVGNGAKILGLFPFPTKSHMIFYSSLMSELARRGHEITVVSCFPRENPQENYTEIILKAVKDVYDSSSNFDLNDNDVLSSMYALWNHGNNISEATFQDPQILNLIHSTNVDFDLVIIETMFSDSLIGFGHRFKAPVIYMGPSGVTQWRGDAIGNPNPYAYVPDSFLPYTDHMSFVQRFHNTWVGTMSRIGRYWYHLPKQNAIMKQAFHSFAPVPDIIDLESRVSLLLVNSHISHFYPRPYVPNVIEVGGMHITPPRILPPDLKSFLDSSSFGAIYFSMGSNVRSADMSKEIIKLFLDVFGLLQQNVLWKWEEDTLPGKPANVRIEKWLPQSDILGHPKILVFITHGGLLSTQEAIYNGIPVIGLPLYGDQHLNVEKCERSGFALKIDFFNLTVDNLLATIKDVLQNPKYKTNAMRVSTLFRDQQVTPLERAVFWTEYVIRHRGAAHLRSAALNLNFVQYFLLDVIWVMIMTIFIMLVSFRSVIRLVLKMGTSRLVTRKQESKKHRHKKKKNKQ